MNLQEQLGALEAGLDALVRAAQAATAAPAAPAPPSEPAAAAAATTAAPPATAVHAAAPDASAAPDTAAEPPGAETTAAKPTLRVGRPQPNEITLTIGGQTVSLHPTQVGQLIEELAYARASMTPEPPAEIPPGWQFVSTKNPFMAVQKQKNGDRLLIMRHTGHGWVPFTFSPDVAIQLYMLLTQR